MDLWKVVSLAVILVACVVALLCMAWFIAQVEYLVFYKEHGNRDIVDGIPID